MMIMKIFSDMLSEKEWWKSSDDGKAHRKLPRVLKNAKERNLPSPETESAVA